VLPTLTLPGVIYALNFAATVAAKSQRRPAALACSYGQLSLGRQQSPEYWCCQAGLLGVRTDRVPGLIDLYDPVLLAHDHARTIRRTPNRIVHAHFHAVIVEGHRSHDEIELVYSSAKVAAGQSAGEAHAWIKFDGSSSGNHDRITTIDGVGEIRISLHVGQRLITPAAI